MTDNAYRRLLKRVVVKSDLCGGEPCIQGTRINVAVILDSLHASAAANGLDTIVTRDINDFKNATLPVFSPTDFLVKVKSRST